MNCPSFEMLNFRNTKIVQMFLNTLLPKMYCSEGLPKRSDQSTPMVTLVTTPNAECAEKLADLLVSGNLAACINIVPGVQSVYKWQGNIEKSSEVLMIIKSVANKIPDLIDSIRCNHPYDVPEIISMPIDQNLSCEKYLKWITSSILQ